MTTEFSLWRHFLALCQLEARGRALAGQLRGALLTIFALLATFGGVETALANLVTVNGVTVQTNLPQATRGAWYSYQVTPTGNAPYSSFALIGGAFPMGVSRDFQGDAIRPDSI